MTTDQLRDIFGRFQNLNLLFLREDLRRGIVARGRWVTDGRTCPLQHGLPECVYRFGCHDAAYAALGISRLSGDGFIRWWDAPIRRDGLLAVVNALLAERLADADAVQAVIEPQLVEACQ